MNKDRLKQLAGVNEARQFNDAGEMLRYVVNELRRSLDYYQQDEDQDCYYVVQDIERILSELDNASVKV